MNKFAICVGYLPSSMYSGFSGQLDDPNNILTIIVQALEEARVFKETDDSQIQYASRTDRGVGAIHQVITLCSNRTPILSEINAHLPEEIQTLSINHVPFEFHPRRAAVLRTYSYFLSFNKDIDTSLLSNALSILKGTHDFRNFSKNDPKKKIRTIKTLEKATFFALGDHTYQIQLASKSFLWQQVRRIVSHLIDIVNGQCELQHTKHLLESEMASPKPTSAPPTGLILENVQYNDLTFQYDQKCLRSFHRIIYEQLLAIKTDKALFTYMSHLLNASTDPSPK